MMNGKTKIVLADDSKSIRAKLTELIEKKGYECVTASDGIECIKKVFEESPSFVILDVKMPVMSGYQACRFLKNHPLTSKIPVMLLTALDQPIDELWGYEAGADYYKSKAQDVNVLVDEVDKIIKESNFKPSFKSKEISEKEILSFLNDFLDKRIFEISMINEIAQLSYKISSLSDVIESCAKTLSKMLEPYFIAFAIADDRGAKINVWSNYEYGIHIEEFNAYIKEILHDSGFNNLSFDYSLGKEPIPGNYYDKREFLYVDPYETLTDKEFQTLRGGVFFCYNKDSYESLKRVAFILPHILLVINNCLLHKKIVDMSITDELTTLYNRRKIMEILNIEIDRANRYGYELSLIIADIDFFKKVNDTYGHNMGDAVLKKVSMILRNSIRKVDYVGRFGGEEFIIISPETSLQNALLLAERIRKIFNSFIMEGLNTPVTLSFGISSYTPGKDLDTLINEADTALYEAKNSGRNQVKVYKG
ncbi:MAG: diguanylate cyclase [Proteobacteria bacterium]|nr:diguanylate cyclase [Pseudomonadota bacterium]